MYIHYATSLSALPVALTGMSIDKMQRQRRPWEWRIAGTNTPIRERDFFLLRLVPHHAVAESIHTPLYRPPNMRNIIVISTLKSPQQTYTRKTDLSRFSRVVNYSHKGVLDYFSNWGKGKLADWYQKEEEFRIAVKGESSCLFLSVFIEIVSLPRLRVGICLLRIFSWTGRYIFIQMVRKLGFF